MNFKFCKRCDRKMASNSEFCPHCGTKQNLVPNNPPQWSGDNYRPRGMIDMNPHAFYVWGLILGTLSYVLLPPLFGGLAAYWGSRLEKVPRYESDGHFLFLFGIVGIVVGMIFGIYIASNQ